MVSSGDCFRLSRVKLTKPENALWKRTRYRYLFNETALAKVFRGKFLAAIDNAGLRPPAGVPGQWVLDCRHSGHEGSLDGRAAHPIVGSKF